MRGGQRPRQDCPDVERTGNPDAWDNHVSAHGPDKPLLSGRPLPLERRNRPRILEQDTYWGRTTNFKTTKLSYKRKKTVINSPDKWAVFEGTHEAIIDKETWEIVRKSREHRRRPTKNRLPIEARV